MDSYQDIFGGDSAILKLLKEQKQVSQNSIFSVQTKKSWEGQGLIWHEGDWQKVIIWRIQGQKEDKLSQESSKKSNKPGAKKTSASTEDKKKEDNLGKAKSDYQPSNFSQLEPDVECCQLYELYESCKMQV